MLEAATYGKPVVASGSETGAGVLLPGKTGLLLQDASPQQLAAALRLLIDDPDLRRRLGEAAAEHARVRFDPATNARAVERVYDELLGLEPEREPAACRRRRMTLVSIVTPSLNQARYLREAIESVRAQTYSPIEHIVVDGGSTDGTLDILSRVQDLRWVSEPDRGQSHALNKGFALARARSSAGSTPTTRMSRKPSPRASPRSRESGGGARLRGRDARERRRR